MLEKLGNFIDTDVLVIGGGAGGLWAGLSAKRHNPSLSVAVLDAHMVGRSGHAATPGVWWPARTAGSREVSSPSSASPAAVSITGRAIVASRSCGVAGDVSSDFARVGE